MAKPLQAQQDTSVSKGWLVGVKKGKRKKQVTILCQHSRLLLSVVRLIQSFDVQYRIFFSFFLGGGKFKQFDDMSVFVVG